MNAPQIVRKVQRVSILRLWLEGEVWHGGKELISLRPAALQSPGSCSCQRCERSKFSIVINIRRDWNCKDGHSHVPHSDHGMQAKPEWGRRVIRLFLSGRLSLWDRHISIWRSYLCLLLVIFIFYFICFYLSALQFIFYLFTIFNLLMFHLSF